MKVNLCVEDVTSLIIIEVNRTQMIQVIEVGSPQGHSAITITHLSIITFLSPQTSRRTCGEVSWVQKRDKPVKSEPVWL